MSLICLKTSPDFTNVPLSHPVTSQKDIALLKSSIATAAEMNKGEDIAFGDLRQSEASFEGKEDIKALLDD